MVAAVGVCGVVSSSSLTAAPSSGRVRPVSALNTAFAADSWGGDPPGAIDAQVLTLALHATRCAVQMGDLPDRPKTLTVIDYSKPSSEPRLWVFDLSTRALLYRELVAHGQGSGDNWATRFSNDDDTHRSSLGLFVADETYVGKNGYSLRLDGLEAGVNDRARDRAIVMHGASYVSAAFVRQQGRLGRSWGCPALSDSVAHQIIDRVKEGGAVFAYYPDQRWLRTSKYLGRCGTAVVPTAAALR
jgi:hypothetical protein